MTFNKKLLAATLLTAGGFAAISSANAAETTSSFGAETTVESICTVKAAPTKITLASVQSGKATAGMSANTSLTLNCSKGNVAVISLTPVSSASLDGTGYLKGGVDGLEQVTYQLATDAAGGTPWGAGTSAYSAPQATAYATDIDTTIHLVMTNTADVTPGLYTDTINVSVIY